MACENDALKILNNDNYADPAFNNCKCSNISNIIIVIQLFLCDIHT